MTYFIETLISSRYATVILAFIAFSIRVSGMTEVAKELSIDQMETAQKKIVEEWKDSVKNATAKELAEERVTARNHNMRFMKRIFGEEPKDGRSLYISLHGGGGTTARANNQQWRNQIQLYAPAEGVYIAPRAPEDTWNMWFLPYMDALYERLIQMCVAHYNVNPNKVYILGYSAGGDGVWRMAPRMADTWAAASMMAGHPGDVSLVNLRNLPFMVWCGANDTPYNRNNECRKRGQELDSLHKDCPNGYIHQTNIIEGKAHWMDMADTSAIGWMAKYKRNPLPVDIVWQQEEVVRQHFYWISVPRDEMKRGMSIRLSCKGNTINISRCDYSSIRLWISPSMFDLEKPVTVNINGKRMFEGKVVPNTETLRSSLHQRGDTAYMFPAYIDIFSSK